MGKAARWLRGLLGGKKKKAPEPARDSTQKPPAKENKGWGLTRSFRDKERGLCEGKEVAGGARGWPAPVGSRVEEKGSSYREAARSYGASAHSPGYSCCSSTACGSAASGLVGAAVVAGDDDEQQSKRAIAVAAATAAVAEAAVAAAQAAAAVVRLTSKEGRAHVSVSDWRSKEWAAVKIQSAFRGYLARRALKALKGLVKIQALVRGHIVRKQAAETMRCMQALVRVQARARAGRTLPDNQAPNKSSRHHHHGPPNPRKNGTSVHVNGAKPDRSNTLRRNASRVKNSGSVDPNTLHPSGWNWLDRWMEDRYWNNNKSSKTGIGTDDEKILEIDAGKPHINSKWRNRTHSMCSTLASDQISHSFMAMPESPSRNSAIAQHSIPSTSSVDMQQQSLSPLRFPLEASQLCESPQYYSASSRLGSSRRGAFTPSKSDCSRSVFSGYPDWPNYMSNTESSKAKVRSHSAPKQRPDYEKSNGARRHSGQGSGVSDLSSLSSQRSSSLHHKFAGKLYPGSGRLDRLGMPIGM